MREMPLCVANNENLARLWVDVADAPEPTKEELQREADRLIKASEEENLKFYQEAGLMQQHISATWELWDKTVTPYVRSMKKEIQRHAAYGKPWLFIHGRTATGKTMTMSLLAMAWIKYGKKVVWTTAKEIQDSLNSWQDGEAKKSRKDFKNCHYLFIDECNRQTMTPGFYDNFFEILRHRDSGKLRVCFATNATVEDFESMCDPALLRRIEENTAFIDFNKQEE